MMWGCLLHLSYNMWSDNHNSRATLMDHWTQLSPTLQCDTDTWREVTNEMASQGLDIVVIDVGDGVVFDSCPEIAVAGAWTPHQLNGEVRRLRGIGLEPIPKLNFAASHDVWLKGYSRMVSTSKYYEVCSAIIGELIDIFETPPLFHLGMDEETASHQKSHDYVVVRQGDLWWNDLYFLVNEVESHGVRPWIWSDHAWRETPNFFSRMPRTVLQSNWYYAPNVSDNDFTGMKHRQHMLRAFTELEANGFDQAPCGSKWDAPENFPNLVKHCEDVIGMDRLAGYLMTTWLPTVPDFRLNHQQAIKITADTRNRYHTQHA